MEHDVGVAADAVGTEYEPPAGWSIDQDSILFRPLKGGDAEPEDFDDGSRTIWREGDLVACLYSDQAAKFDAGMSS